MAFDVAEARPCADPECDGLAEPEEDGDHRFLVCSSCGFTFGFERIEVPGSDCQLGIPEAVRRIASPAGTRLPPAPVPVTLRRRSP